jgi:hypothetical protein
MRCSLKQRPPIRGFIIAGLEAVVAAAIVISRALHAGHKYPAQRVRRSNLNWPAMPHTFGARSVRRRRRGPPTR